MNNEGRIYCCEEESCNEKDTLLHTKVTSYAACLTISDLAHSAVLIQHACVTADECSFDT